jgi:hypothetical protein
MSEHLKIDYHTTSKKCKEEIIKNEIPVESNKIIVENYSHYCLLCNVMFENETLYKEHSEMYHTNIENKEFPCDLCSKSFKAKSHLKIHVSKTHNKKKKFMNESNEEDTKKHNHHCIFCKKSFITLNILKLHIHDAHNIEGTCPICENIYKNVGSHVTTKHLDINKYKCKFCPKKFVGILKLKEHVNIEHPIVRFIVNCKICNEEFPRKKFLREHLKIKHDIVRKALSYLCHLCGFDSKSKAALQVHLSSKHNIQDEVEKKRYNCTKCKKHFTRIPSLNSHINIVHNKIRIVCKICKQKFRSPQILRRHQYSFHNVGSSFEKEPKFVKGKFECPVCFRRYLFEKGMKNHYTREHVPCTCDMCNRNLQGKHSMSKHLEYSHGFKKKVYHCKICDHVALTKGRLHKHMALRHGKKDSKI